MSDKQHLEHLKADFLEKNTAFAKAVKQLTIENSTSLENKSRICALRKQAVVSYDLLADFVMSLKISC